MRRRKGLVRTLTYLVGIAIPALDRRGHRLPKERTERWQRRALDELQECFGGATPVPAPGTNVVTDPRTGRVTRLYEEGQTLVLAACRSRAEFMRQRSRIGAFADRMGRALNQEAVFVLACPSDCMLIEMAVSTRPVKTTRTRVR